ncbi:MAG TPA: hypothetical protein VIK75_02670 [Calditerricola sp.]
MPRRRMNSLKLTIRLLPEDVGRLDELRLPGEPRSTAAARLLQRVLRQPDPLEEIRQALWRIEQRMSSWQPQTAQASKDDKAHNGATPPQGEEREPKAEGMAAKRKEPDKSTKPDLGLAGILEGFDLQ